MNLSRKRKKELKRLKGDATDLWLAQQELLDHANSVAREASRQLGVYGREEVVPQVVHAYEKNVQPVVSRIDDFKHDVVANARHGLNTKVIPAVGGAVGAILSIGDVAKDARVQAALHRLQPRKPVPVKTGPNVGTVIAIGAGVLAAAGVAYAVWQTFRADDELWVADDEPILPNT